MPTHKKAHDKDKYYHLAKDQGYRSRAAFKLIQINKRFDFLSKARVCIDLCAAPGGWCQVASKYMPVGSIVLGVDLLPIKAIRNVKTLIGDITTAECRRNVNAELQGWKADVVLCDGAPNIGSAYSKDAYVQNELVLAALKSATDHLVAGGTFCTKVYRSADYNSLVWVLQQLFEDVQTIKPNSSRSQSSEIFLVCLKYTAPKFIDPKFLDPNHVFKEVADPGLQTVDVMHKRYEKSNLRHRTGYDESLGMLLSRTESVSGFVANEDPVRMLTDVNKFEFTDKCAKYKDHPSTTEELKICFQDLRILGKVDFKKILKWRQVMRAAFNDKDTHVLDGNESDVENGDEDAGPQMTEEERIQADIKKFHALAQHQQKKDKKKTREQMAKDRARQALGMSNQSFGVEEDQELFSMSEKLTLAQMKELADVNLGAEEAEDILKVVTGESVEETGDGEGALSSRAKRAAASGVSVTLTDAIEDELEDDYIRYLTAKAAKKNTNKEKKKKNKDPESALDGDESRLPSTKRLAYEKQSDQNISKLAAQDEELNTYVKLLNESTAPTTKPKTKGKHAKKDGKEGEEDRNSNFYRNRSSDDDTSSDEEEEPASRRRQRLDSDADSSADDASDDDEEEEEEEVVQPKGKRSRTVVSRDVESLNSKASKWFSNPIFSSKLIDNEDAAADGASDDNDNDDADDNKVQVSGSNSKKQQRVKKLSAGEEAELMMPKTDKEKRKDARKKSEERANRKENRLKRKGGADEDDALALAMENEADSARKKVSKRGLDNGEDEVSSRAAVDGKTDISKVLSQRLMIKEGMGSSAGRVSNNKKQEDLGFEVVASDPLFAGDDTASKEMAALLEKKDTRDYDSDNEQYDAHDRVQTLALGTMMLRNSKRKAMVDASYNRFAWNDPKGLPEWFMDDEMRHNKPQLPIPQALVDQIKSRYQITGTKEIKKVAEARARKRKRAEGKLKAAKKQANVMAENSEMSEKMKLRVSICSDVFIMNVEINFKLIFEFYLSHLLILHN